MLVEVLQWGAMGISLACLSLAFKNNLDLNKRAADVPTVKLTVLVKQARWTMVFATVCLTAAVVLELRSHTSTPVMLAVDIHPTDFKTRAKDLRFIKDVAQPVLVRLAGSDQVPKGLENGTVRFPISQGSTLSIDVSSLLWAISANENVARATRTEPNLVEPRL